MKDIAYRELIKLKDIYIFLIEILFGKIEQDKSILNFLNTKCIMWNKKKIIRYVYA